jgi:hypothetical protein
MLEFTFMGFKFNIIKERCFGVSWVGSKLKKHIYSRRNQSYRKSK